MIKFFRNIRQKLITEGKLVNYFKYAIGEILLVMIGILLALQVNNWNTKRQRLTLEKTLLKEVNDVLKGNLMDLKADLWQLNRGHKAHIEILKYLEEDRPYAETLCFEFSWLVNDEYIIQVTSSFEAIKDAGLNIISNDSIKGALVSIYEGGFPRLSNEHPFYPDLEEFYEEYYHKNFKPNDDTTLVYKEFDGFDTLSFPRKTYFDGEPFFIHLGYVPLDFETLKRDPEFKMLLQKASKFRRWKIARYERVYSAISELLGKIEKELLEKGI